MIGKLFLLSIFLPLISSNWNAKYHYVALEQFECAKEELSKIPLLGNERILDVGCGTGRASNLFAQHVPQGSVLAIDSSEDLIKFAQKEYENIKNLSFQVVDVSHMDFCEEFDVICSFFCLHWVRETQQEAIKNIATSLKPGGRAYLYINIIEDKKSLDILHSNIDEILSMHSDWKSSMSLANFQPTHVWLSYVQEAGFIINNWDTVSLEHVFKNKSQCKEYNYTLGTTSLSDEEHKKFIDLIVDKLYNHYNVKDHELFVQKTKILVLELTRKS